jgi:hypothetical protein
VKTRSPEEGLLWRAAAFFRLISSSAGDYRTVAIKRNGNAINDRRLRLKLVNLTSWTYSENGRLNGPKLQQYRRANRATSFIGHIANALLQRLTDVPRFFSDYLLDLLINCWQQLFASGNI